MWFDTRSSKGWELRFYIRESPIAGKGLFAARDYGKEYLAVYMGEDLGAEGSKEAQKEQTHRTAIGRADHMMAIAGRIVDGRQGRTGAQYINTSTGTTEHNNAKFTNTGAVRVADNSTIRKGDEILYAYGAEYWRIRRTETQRHERDERVGGAIAYTRHNGGADVFIEEVLTARGVRGRALRVGERLFEQVLQRTGAATQRYHLIVRQDNGHAVRLYTRLGFSNAAWEL